MTNLAEARWKVTGAGGLAVALMIATWIAGMATGHGNPTSWIGQVISLPFGTSVFISLVVMLFAVMGAASAVSGRPFFVKTSDA